MGDSKKTVTRTKERKREIGGVGVGVGVKGTGQYYMMVGFTPSSALLFRA